MAPQKRPPPKSPQTLQQEKRIAEEQRKHRELRKKDQAQAWAKTVRSRSNALIQKLEMNTPTPYKSPIQEIKDLRKILSQIAPINTGGLIFVLGIIIGGIGGGLIGYAMR